MKRDPRTRPVDSHTSDRGARGGREARRVGLAQRTPPAVASPGEDEPLRELKRQLRKARLAYVSAQRQAGILAERNAVLERELFAALQREAEALRLAYHDPLTGLPNRSLLEDRLRQAILTARRRKHLVALLLLDLDGFKRINDELGHAAGDELLRIEAGRLTTIIRGADTACRYGGDEFVVMLPHIDHAEEVANVAAKIRKRLADPCLIHGGEVTVTASLGTAVYPADGGTYEELIRRADLAMYRDKERGTPGPG